MSISLTKPAVGSTGWGAAVNQNWTDIENAINTNILPRGYIDGLVIANNGTVKIDVAAGVARDSTNVDDMNLSSSLTKDLSAAWAVGNNNGGLDAGSKENSTWYHVWLIKRSDTGVVDALFCTSATAPTMPTNYDRKRRIGSIRTDGSGNLLSFAQLRNKFIWKTPISDISGSSLGTSATLFTLSVPSGVKVIPVINAFVSKGGASVAAIVTSPDANDVAPSAANASSFTHFPANQLQANWCYMSNEAYWTNTSSQLRFRADQASCLAYVGTFGWWDFRGCDS